MTALLASLLGPTWAGRLAAFGAALLGLLAAVGLIYRAGRKSAEADEIRRTLDNLEDAHDARRDVDRLPDGAAADRLRRDWSRD